MCTNDALKEEIDDLKKKVESLESKFESFETTAGKSITHFLNDMDEIKELVKEHNESTKELKEAWSTATGFAKFIKWLSGLLAGCAIIWAYTRDLLSWKIGG